MSVAAISLPQDPQPQKPQSQEPKHPAPALDTETDYARPLPWNDPDREERQLTQWSRFYMETD